MLRIQQASSLAITQQSDAALAPSACIPGNFHTRNNASAEGLTGSMLLVKWMSFRLSSSTSSQDNKFCQGWQILKLEGMHILLIRAAERSQVHQTA
mmetsp:Transcript_8956/g.55081  ORF Transcript_8956/g.55081 Transcript_8956/m.55081 type:complete len:96 (+) Transcript_8956:762-1049(+)